MKHLTFRAEQRRERSCLSRAVFYQTRQALSTGISRVHVAVPRAVSRPCSVGWCAADQGENTILVISGGAPKRIGGPQYPVPRLT
jgi:hypothetical protein